MIVAALRHQLSLGITSSSDCGVSPQLLAVYRAIDAQRRAAVAGQRDAAAAGGRRAGAGAAAGAVRIRHAARRHDEVSRRRRAERRDRGAERQLSPRRRRRACCASIARNCSALCRETHDAGWRIATHAIGDVAIDQMLDIYESLGPHPRGFAHRIEHFGLPDATQLARASRL